jgi:predicted RNA-binding protein with PUA-like domain
MLLTQARNLMKSMKVGDRGFFYHSNAKKQTGIAGTVEIVREAYPDESASNPKSKYYDAKHTPDSPVWFMVDVKAMEKFDSVILLQSLKENMASGDLSDMMLLKKGSRLSVQPVSKSEWDYINNLAVEK